MTRRSPAPAATRAASCCACCSATLTSSRPARRRQQRRAARHRPAPAPAAAGRPGLRRHRPRGAGRRPTWSSSRCRTASPAALAAQLPATSRSSTSAPTTGWPDAADWAALYGAPARRAPGPTACRSCPGSGLRRGARPGRGPGCYATASTLALAPAARRRPGRAARTSSSSPRSGTSGAGRAAEGHLLGTEVMGDLSRVQGRRPPAHPRDASRPAARLAGARSR